MPKPIVGKCYFCLELHRDEAGWKSDTRCVEVGGCVVPDDVDTVFGSKEFFTVIQHAAPGNKWGMTTGRFRRATPSEEAAYRLRNA